MDKLNEKVGTFFSFLLLSTHIFMIVDFIIFFDKSLDQFPEKTLK
ncbi:MAG: hypothetical protein ACTHKJ_08455 [Candidatus Nitrosocosmicus sp.]